MYYSYFHSVYKYLIINFKDNKLFIYKKIKYEIYNHRITKKRIN